MSALLHIFKKLYMNYACTDSLRKHRSVKRKIIKRSAKEKYAVGAYADSEGPDQTAHLRSLIWAFADRLQNRWILQDISVHSKGPYRTWFCCLIWFFTVPMCPEDASGELAQQSFAFDKNLFTSNKFWAGAFFFSPIAFLYLSSTLYGRQLDVTKLILKSR